MTTGAESMSGWPSVQVQSPLTAQPQGHVGAYSSTHRALPLTCAGRCCASGAGGPFFFPVAPVVVAVYVTAVDINPGLLLVNNLALGQAGEGQRVEAHRTLRPRSVQLLSKALQLFESRSMPQSGGGPPQQGCSTQINQ